VSESNVSGIVIQLTPAEAEWLVETLGLVMRLARQWDGNIATDPGNHLLAVLNLARIRADGQRWSEQAKDPHH